MKPDVVTYSQRPRAAGYRLGYCGKWHASHVRGPMDFGFHENGDPMGVDDAYLARHNVPEAERYARTARGLSTSCRGGSSWRGRGRSRT